MKEPLDHRPRRGFCSGPEHSLSVGVTWVKPLLPLPEAQLPYELSQFICKALPVLLVDESINLFIYSYTIYR